MSPRERIEKREILIFDSPLTKNLLDPILIPIHAEYRPEKNLAGDIGSLEIEVQSEIRNSLELNLDCLIDPKTFKARIRRTTPQNHFQFKSLIHADPYELTTVTYLAPHSLECFQMATRFYEHKKSGLRHFSRENSRDFYISKIILENHNSLPEHWEEWVCVRYQAGRTVCFSGYLFHSSPPLTDLQSERLTLECFANFQEK